MAQQIRGTNISDPAATIMTGTEAGGLGGTAVDNTATSDNTAGNMSSTTTNKKPTQETLFGPNIGLVSGGPSWAATHEKKVVTDDLTPDVVKGWVEKSKQPSQPTTTLQALVNLKRPSLRLSPLSSDEASSPSPTDAGDDHIQVLSTHHFQLHGLEFEYDCDAPKCGIYVHVLVPKGHPEALTTVSPSGFSKILVFDTVTEGGFGRLLKLEDGATLELGRFEQGRKTKSPSSASSSGGQHQASMSADAVFPSSSSDPRLIAGAASPISGITEVLASVHETGENNTNTANNKRKRFSAFPFRRRGPSQARSVSGPALAVVDMGQQSTTEEHDGSGGDGGAGSSGADDPASTPAAPALGNTTKGRGRKKDADEGQGVRVSIRLAALDELGTELISPNEQVTYLHIVRFGTRDPTVEEGSAEDTRPWVVKVVKREATIGPHTFHLHEIYGLSSSSSAHTSMPTAPLPKQQHSYPPEAPSSVSGAGVVGSGITEDDSQSECLLCLSAPREVVLLPCRHLVACRECALNMVEFGAGGQITQSNDDSGTNAAADAGTEGTGAAGAGGTEGGANGTAPPVTVRRRRKAKGWYCPVCRQPYTSLLRITTHPPAPEKSSASTKSVQSATDGVREAADGVENLSVGDQPTSGNDEDVNEGSRNTGSGLGRMFRLGRRSANASAADENV